jgi:hypothetical protein
MNRYLKRDKKVKVKRVSRFRAAMLGLLAGTFLGRDGVVRHMPFLMFLVLIAIAYISYGYKAESTVKRMYDLESEVKDLKAQDLTLKTDLEQVKQQSHVAEAIKELGLKESMEQPYKIQLEKAQ